MSDTSTGPLVLVDLGMGNLRSVERALRAALDLDVPGAASGPEILVSSDPGAVREAGAVVVPGQGAFGDCAEALERHGGALGRSLRDHIADDRPYLGICLGLQCLFEDSAEAPGQRGLGVFAGSVDPLPPDAHNPDATPCKIPHMGWNTLSLPPSPPTDLLVDGQWFYFVHSFRVVPRDRSLIAAESHHGVPFVAAVARGRLLGVQFHPEKSQGAGIDLLRRYFAAVTPWR